MGTDEPQEPAVDAEAEEMGPEEPEGAPAVTAAPEDVSGADAFKPTSEDLVVSESRDVFEVMDAHDVEQIIDAMQGRLLDVSLYSFEQGGQRVTELSWKGVRECVQEMNATQKCRIGVVPDTLRLERVEEDGEILYEAIVFARDELSGAGFFGYAREPKMQKRKQGPPVEDKFAPTKAINKAERNALRKFIPEKLAQTLIAQFLHDERRVRQIRSGGPMVGKVAELPPAVETEEAKALVAECDRLWEEIKTFEGFAGRITPSNFFAWKVTAMAQSPDDPEDVSKLVQFRDLLVNARDDLKAAADGA